MKHSAHLGVLICIEKDSKSSISKISRDNSSGQQVMLVLKAKRQEKPGNVSTAELKVLQLYRRAYIILEIR